MPYRLFIDIHGTQSLLHSRRGIARYVAGHTAALVRRAGVVEALALNPFLPAPDNLPSEVLNSGKLVWSSAVSFRAARRRGPLALFLSSPFELGTPPDVFLPPYALGSDVPLVVTLYDLIPLLRPEAYLSDPNLAQAYSIRLGTIRRANMVLAISESTRRDAIRLLNLDPAAVFNIGAGLSNLFRPASAIDKPSAMIRAYVPSITGPFVLSVLGAEERKNAGCLISAYARLPASLRRRHQLVIACGVNEDYRQRWRAHAEKEGLRGDELVLTGLIDDSLLLSLYQTARLFVFPSLYEGFGFPVLEAAACGCPVISSNNSSLPEVLNHEPATFDASDPDAIAELMQRVLTDSNFDASIRAASRKAASLHNWDAVAARTLDALKSLRAPAARPRVSGRKLRIALAGPFPPTRSGIADYNFRLAHELAGLCDLHLLFSQGTPDRSQNGALPAPRFSLTALGRRLNPYSYDAIIYTFGNSDHHHETLETALRYPGVVWLHDTQLSGLYMSYAEARKPHQTVRFLAEKLLEMYGSRAPSALTAQPIRPLDDYIHFGIGMCSELVNHASGVIVNSELARRSLQLDGNPFTAKPPFRVLPLAAEEPSMAGVPPLGTGRILLGSFGIGARHKAPEILIDALKLVKEHLPAELVFVGPTDWDPQLRPSLELRARDAGVMDAVHFAGDVGAAEYSSYLHRVACAVQLRLNSHGESSAAVNDCLSHGVPVITNVAACREMPPGTVEFIDEELSPASVASRIRMVLEDEERRRGLSSAGLQYAKRTSFRRIAEGLLAFVEEINKSSLQAGVPAEREAVV